MISGTAGKPIMANSEPLPNTMHNLMNWEYGRKWLQDRDASVEKRSNVKKPKPKGISNSVQSWLEKRKKANSRGHSK